MIAHPGKRITDYEAVEIFGHSYSRLSKKNTSQAAMEATAKLHVSMFYRFGFICEDF